MKKKKEFQLVGKRGKYELYCDPTKEEDGYTWFKIDGGAYVIESYDDEEGALNDFEDALKFRKWKVPKEKYVRMKYEI